MVERRVMSRSLNCLVGRGRQALSGGAGEACPGDMEEDGRREKE